MEKSDQLRIEAKYSPVDMGEGIFVNMKASKPFDNAQDATGDMNSKYILLLLDVSGSMSGTPIETCKEVLVEMFKYLHNDLRSTNIDLGVFNTECKVISLKDQKLDYCLSKVDRIRAGGGTKFIPVFKKI